MARIFDVVEYASEMADEIVRRFPETGAGDFRIGSQVIVRESQRAVFARDGRALDVFGPGRHTITTANIPLLIDFVGRAFNNRSPFTAEVYFVSMREFVDRKWGTPQPIVIMTPGMGLGVALIQGFGTYSFSVADAQQFVTQVVGNQGVYRTRDIEDRFRTVLLSKLQDAVTEIKFNTIPDLLSMTEELGSAIRAKAQDDFLSLGITLKSFYIGSLQPSERSIEELRSRGLLDLSTYTQLQAADAMRDAAQNPSGGAGLTAGIGAGMGIGKVLSQTLQGQVGGGAAAAQGQPQQGGGGSGGSAMPDVMTPSEAAAQLRVSEEDVMAAIESGDLKARQIGSAYRISRAALEDFLKG